MKTFAGSSKMIVVIGAGTNGLHSLR